MVATALTVDYAPAAPAGTGVGTGTNLTLGAGDASNGNTFPSTGKELLFCRNSSTSVDYTITVTATPDPYGRSVNIVQTLTHNGSGSAEYILGPFPQLGWINSAGLITVTVQNAAVLVEVIRLP